MKTFIIKILTTLIVIVQMNCTQANTKITVNYLDFDTQTYVPIKEEDLENQANCKVEIVGTSTDIDFINQAIDNAKISEDFDIDARLK